MSTQTTNRVTRHLALPALPHHRVYELAHPIPYLRPDATGNVRTLEATGHILAADPTDRMAELRGVDFTVIYPCTATGQVLGEELAESDESFDDAELIAGLGVEFTDTADRPVKAAIDRRCARLADRMAGQAGAHTR